MRRQMNRTMGTTLAGLSVGVMLAATAHAQSSVTLYGVVDTGVTYTNNQQGHSAWEATSGNESAPRWGLMGTEDLGGGLKTTFRLENGFNIDNGQLGQGGRLFGRQAFVGMSSDKLGTVTLGRQYNAVQDILGNMQISGTLTGYAAHPHDNDDINNTFRTNNSAKYVSPSIAGLQTNLMYGFSNATGFASNNSWSAGVKYTNGPLNLGAAYAHMNHPASSAAGAVASDNYLRQRVDVRHAARRRDASDRSGARARPTRIGLRDRSGCSTPVRGLQRAGRIVALRFGNYEGSVRLLR